MAIPAQGLADEFRQGHRGALEGWLSSLEDKDRTIVRMSIVGQVSVAQKARLDEVLEHHTDLLRGH